MSAPKAAAAREDPGEEVPLASLPEGEQQQVLQAANALRNSLRQLVGKMGELDTERSEHALVEKTIKDLDPKRRCFRMVGGVLVERTVEEVLPALRANMANISKIMDTLEEKRRAQDRDLRMIEIKYGIARRTPQQQLQQAKAQMAGGGDDDAKRA